MTVYTISEVLSEPNAVERSDKFYNETVVHHGDLDLLRRFSTFANSPMEGMSCGLIWWLLHASGVNRDCCAACHNTAVSLSEPSMMQVSGTGNVRYKTEFLQWHGHDRRWSEVGESALSQKSCEPQRLAASRLMELSSRCSIVDITREELERCYIEQSEPLRAFAVALTVWVANQGGKNGWLRPFLFGQFAARQEAHYRLAQSRNLDYTMRYNERLKTTVLRPGIVYDRGFQWLAIQKVKHQRNRPDCFKASPTGVYSEGHVMRIFTSRDYNKEMYLSMDEIQSSIYAQSDWRVLDTWSNNIRGSGPYCGFAYHGATIRKVVFDRPGKLDGIILGGFFRHDGVWFSPHNKKLRLARRENALRISHLPFRLWDVVHPVTDDTIFV